jgi:hypothetical protein
MTDKRKFEIKEVGSLLSIDSQGYLLNAAHMSKIQRPWKEAVDEIVLLYQTYFGHRLHSLYLRGSVAKGTAIEHFSDIDIMALLRGPVTRSDEIWAYKTHQELEKKYKFATSIRPDFIVWEEVFSPDMTLRSFHFNFLFTLQTQGICLYGEDISPHLPPIKCDKVTALLLLQDLDVLFERVKNDFSQKQRDKYIKELCQWIMKAMIRNSFLLFMEREKAFTRDLYPCYLVFTKYYPHQQESIKKCLEYAINPISDKTEIIFYLDNFGMWLKEQIEAYFLE